MGYVGLVFYRILLIHTLIRLDVNRLIREIRRKQEQWDLYSMAVIRPNMASSRPHCRIMTFAWWSAWILLVLWSNVDWCLLKRWDSVNTTLKKRVALITMAESRMRWLTLAVSNQSWHAESRRMLGLHNQSCHRSITQPSNILSNLSSR